LRGSEDNRLLTTITVQEFSFPEQQRILKLQFFARARLSSLTLRARLSSNILPSPEGEDLCGLDGLC